MKTTAEYNKAVQIVTEVINKWDPYGLIAGGAGANEFETPISNIVTHVSRFRSAEDATIAVSNAFSSLFEAEKFTRQYCSEVGAELYERLIRAGLIKRTGSSGHFLDGITNWFNSLFKK